MGFDVERDGLLALSQEADQLAARLANALPSDATYIGEDPSGTVRVTVDSAGRVVDVELTEPGPAHQTADLGDAVLVALEDAAGRRLSSWAEAVATRDTGDSIPRPPSPTPGPFGAEDLVTLLRRVDDHLDALSRQATDREISTHGPVTVTLRGGQVVGVRLDRQWCATVGRARIATELRAAFTEAYRLVEDASPTPDPIAELRAMTANVEILLRRLGST
jgi:hypothetical protein